MTKVYEVYYNNLSSEETAEVKAILDRISFMVQTSLNGKFFVAFFDGTPDLKTILVNYNVEFKDVTKEDLIQKYYKR